jgi:hypothetical protein
MTIFLSMVDQFNYFYKVRGLPKKWEPVITVGSMGLAPHRGKMRFLKST